MQHDCGLPVGQRPRHERKSDLRSRRHDRHPQTSGSGRTNSRYNRPPTKRPHRSPIPTKIVVDRGSAATAESCPLRVRDGKRLGPKTCSDCGFAIKVYDHGLRQIESRQGAIGCRYHQVRLFQEKHVLARRLRTYAEGSRAPVRNAGSLAPLGQIQAPEEPSCRPCLAQSRARPPAVTAGAGLEAAPKWSVRRGSTPAVQA